MLLIDWLKWRHRPARRRLARRLPVRQASERLEDRTLPATITVTSLSDNLTVDTQVTLREAIEAANSDAPVDGSTAGGGADTIVFASGLTVGGPATITLSGTDLLLRTDINIVGPGISLLTINANLASRIFVIGDLEAGNVLNVSISGLTLTNGRADFGGAIQSSEDLTLSQMKITNSSATAVESFGGGVQNGDRVLMIEDSLISGNSANTGGGVSNSGTLRVVRSAISGNTATINGGGLGNTGEATVISSTISGNSGQSGGGIGNQGTLTVLNSTLNGNTASSFGGGIANANSESAQLAVIQTTLSGNSAPLGGGGIGIGDAGSVTVSQSTITGNSATSVRTGGGIAFGVPNTVVTNSIIAGNTVAGSPNDFNFQAVLTADSKNNLVGDPNSAGGLIHGTNGNIVGGGTGAVRSFLATSSIINTALANNGGLTKTHALVVGSPAINAGSNALIPDDTQDIDGDNNVAEDIPFDQRLIGFSRLAAGTVDIGAFEVPPPKVSVAVAPVAVLENGTTNLVYTFTRTSTLGALTANFDVAGSAIFNTDFSVTGATSFSGTSGTVTFAAGSATKTITIDPTADSIVEASETVELTVVDGTSYVAGAAAQATGTITNDDATFSIAVANATRAEGNSGSTLFTFTVTRADSTAAKGSVQFVVTGSGDNPANAADFGPALPKGVATFAVGVATATITVSVAGNTIQEADEGFTVTLSAPVGGELGAATTATGLIQNDDSAFSVEFEDASRAEEGNAGTTPFTFRVTRGGLTTAPASVKFAVTAPAGGANAADFGATVLPSGMLTFGAGVTSQSITLNVAGDTVVENNESFVLTLSAPIGGVLGTPSAASAANATIITDDTALAIAVATNGSSKVETHSGTVAHTFTVTRSGLIGGESSALFAVTPSGTNPADTSDFLAAQFPTGTVNFLANETTRTITINTNGDTSVEPTETFTVTLSNPSGATSLSPASAIGTIIADDSSFSIAPLSANKAEGNSSTTPFTFTVTRNGGTLGTASVAYTVSGSGENQANVADFGTAFPIGIANFAAGAATATVTINVKGDTTFEPDNGFTISLSNPVGGVLNTATADGTILSDDATLTIAATAANRLERTGGDATPFTFTVTRTGGINVPASVKFSTSTNGTGAAGAAAADFSGNVFPAGIASFAATEATKLITINVNPDSAVELNEVFKVTLSAPTGGATLGAAAAIVANGTIQNDDTSLSIEATSAVKAEGHVESTSFTLTVTRIGDTSGTSTANFAVSGAAANAADAADFGGAFPAGIVEFAASETTRLITIDVLGDTVVESNEGFRVTLTNPTNATLATAIANGTINNDDTSFAIAAQSATSAHKAEGNANNLAFTFTITRLGVPVIGSVQFAVSGTGDNPAAAADFANASLPTGTANFTAAQTSQTLTINVKGDTTVEADETFAVTLANPTNATLAVAEAIGTIKNDDASFAIAATEADKSEGNSGNTSFTFSLTRAGMTTGTASVRFAVIGTVGANPAAIADFGTAFPSGTLNFAANETSKVVTINVKGDTAFELDEGFTVTLSSPSSGATIVVLSAQGTIRNDD